MNMNRKSLGQILASFQSVMGLAGGKSASTETTTETKVDTADKTDTDPDTDSDAGKTDEPKADETKTDDGAEKNTESGKVETEKGASTTATGGAVSMSLEDYDKLVSMASLAIEATEENKGLKAKADRWDAYQAALGGGKPSSDSAGAKAGDSKADDTVTDEYAELRKKHGSLMAGI